MIETFHDYKGCQIAIKQTMKRHKGQKVRTIAYRFHIWASEELGRYQYISKKSEAFATEIEALGAAWQIIDIISRIFNRQTRRLSEEADDQAC